LMRFSFSNVPAIDEVVAVELGNECDNGRLTRQLANYVC
jgi:hypothetical protein